MKTFKSYIHINIVNINKALKFTVFNVEFMSIPLLCLHFFVLLQEDCRNTLQLEKIFIFS